MERTPGLHARFDNAAQNVRELSKKIGLQRGPEKFRVGSITEPTILGQINRSSAYSRMLGALEDLALDTARFHKPHGNTKRKITEANIAERRTQFDAARAEFRTTQQQTETTTTPEEALNQLKGRKHELFDYPFGYKINAEVDKIQRQQKQDQEVAVEKARLKAHFDKQGRAVTEEQLTLMAKEICGYITIPEKKQEEDDDTPAYDDGRHTSGFGSFMRSDIDYRGSR